VLREIAQPLRGLATFVIEDPFHAYLSLPTKKCETNKPVDVVVADLATYLLPIIHHDVQIGADSPIAAM